MTTPAQPQPYPGDLPQEVAPTRRRFTDTTGAPLYGYLTARGTGDAYLTLEVRDGEIQESIRGKYRVVGTLSGPNGVHYVAEELIL